MQIYILPKEMKISDFCTNTIYEQVIMVRNISKTAMRIRISQPKTCKFRCDYDMKGSIAAGLQVKLLVTFESSQLVPCYDSFKIHSEDDTPYEY